VNRLSSGAYSTLPYPLHAAAILNAAFAFDLRAETIATTTSHSGLFFANFLKAFATPASCQTALQAFADDGFPLSVHVPRQ